MHGTAVSAQLQDARHESQHASLGLSLMTHSLHSPTMRLRHLPWLAFGCWSKLALAHDDPEDTEAVEVVVVGDSTGMRQASASETTVSREELLRRPRRRPGDLVEAAPGLISVQHAGGGKANQYFLRGFDIDHGTDLALSVDGVPVNFPSHGHGQGYTDLHFLIPELMTKLTVHKGPYYPRFGDFATAGALEFNLANHLPEAQVSAAGGQFGIRRAVGVLPLHLADSTQALVAAEGYMQDGPFVHPERLGRMNLFARLRHELSPTVAATLTTMHYSANWNASGQIPTREVKAGRLDRFGSLDPTEGGATQRHSDSLRIEAAFDAFDFDALLYRVQYDWRLFSNFTFFLDDPTFGDQIEQVDKRDVWGTDMHATNIETWPWARVKSTLGLQTRSDHIRNGLFHDQARQRLETRVDAEVAQTSLSVYLDERVEFFPWLTVLAGGRVDRMDVAVDDVRQDVPLEDRNSGLAHAVLVSPKASLVLSPLRYLDFFVNFGRGFHSNDARGATFRADPASLLVPATGYEVATQLRLPSQLTLTSALYLLDLDSEQVYVGDAGTTEPGARSRRYGVELTGVYNPSPWLSLDASATFNRAKYTAAPSNGGVVPLAPTQTASAGATLKLPQGSFGSVRVRHVGERPANEDRSLYARGFSIVSAMVGHRYQNFEGMLTIDNLLDSQWEEVQFATESRLQNEVQPVDEIHFAPGWPFTAMITLNAYL